MGKVIRLNRDRLCRYNFYSVEPERQVLKYLSSNSFVPIHIRFLCRIKLHSKLLKFRFPYSRLHNFCLLTGKSRSVISRFRLSHISFNKFAKSGSISGVYKSSWLTYSFIKIFRNGHI